MILCSSQAIEALARKHQMRGEPQPLSLITMLTSGEGLNVTEEELSLRGRAIQLSHSERGERDCVEAITGIMKILRLEGVDKLQFEREDGVWIAEELRPFLNQSPDVNEDLLLYHILIWKTAGDRVWTMERHPNECRVVPYIPALLEASCLEMSGEICVTGEHLMTQEGAVSNEVTASIAISKKDQGVGFLDNWQEVSFLEFLNATLPAEKVDQARGPTNQPLISVVSTKDRKLTWRGATDSDHHNGEEVFENDERKLYVRTVSDVRILYENRPECMNKMVLGQFASEYRLLKPSGRGYEKAKNSINEATSIGPDSDHLVAGTRETAAPKTMMLKNGKIMKRREDVHAVPNLFYSGCSSKHMNQLMWSPWQELEEVTGVQDEHETEDQKKTRLELLPFSLYPIEEEDSLEDDL